MSEGVVSKDRALQTRDNTQGALDEANRYIQKPYTEETRAAG